MTADRMLGRRLPRSPVSWPALAGLLALLALAGAAVALVGPLTIQGPAMLRLRIVAASNRPADQAQKLAVRNAVVAELAPAIGRVETRGAALALARADMAKVRAVARSVVGPTVPVNVRLGLDTFPPRRLGWLRFPAGSYDTLLVTLGAGRGHNWWTVLFPPFAFISFGDHIDVVGPPNPPPLAAPPGPVAVVPAGSAQATPVEVRFALWDLWERVRDRF